MKLTTGGKILLVLLAIGGVWGIKWFMFDSKWAVVESVEKTSQIVAQVDLPDAPKNAQSTVAPKALPSSDANNSPVQIKWQMWAWNAQMGAILANGGEKTTKGSIMEKRGVSCQYIWQEDIPAMQQFMIKSAQDYKMGLDKTGCFVSIMGDGAPAFLAALQPQLDKIGSEYHAKIFYTAGKSYGEDKLMGPPSWKENPQNAKGGVVAAVLRDGDWNIAVKWASDNNIPINADEKTYDPGALNFIAADSYVEAGEKYITGYTEERDNIISGKKIGKKTIHVDGVATWTPVDVTIATKKGGLVSILSTKENSSQMPCVIIGIDKWLKDNKKTVQNFMLAVADGGDQVKCFSTSLDKAGEISAKLYQQNDGPYWVKYYKGTQEVDAQKLVVDLGGSRVHNLSDNLQYFGISSGSTNVFRIVYKMFGDIAQKLYPEIMPSYPSADDAIDLSYLEALSKTETNLSDADQTTYSDDNIKQTVAKKSWTIQFETGSASFTPDAKETLDLLFDALVVNQLKVEVRGHTDNVGDPTKNYTLSVERANAIKYYLELRSKQSFPKGRIITSGYGDTDPIASNATAVGRSSNRRVEIVMGN